jgi:GH25 family lysozyme M1 (1,4-beta-N-acetylmuramidase)
MEPIKGIDVSKWQGDIDWAKVKAAGIQFAIIRTSFGTTGTDKYFKANVENAHAAGIPCGAYHYCYAKTVDESKAEAQHFLDVIKGYQFEYPVCLDLEDKCQDGISVSEYTDMAIAFLEELEQAGYYVAIYSGKARFMSRLDDSKLKPYTHWVAQWNKECTYPGTVGIWQYTSDGSVDGINGRVDMDISYNDYPSMIKGKGLNGFTISKTSDFKKIVLYLDDADIFPAVPVSQEMHCPLMKKSDFEEQDLKADEIIPIGGKPGSNRKSTFKDAAALL